MNKENKHSAANQQEVTVVANEQKPSVPCRFEELKDDFLIQREIGRGKLAGQLFILFGLGSYGVVFKAVRNEKKMQGQQLNGEGDTILTHNAKNHGTNYSYPENSSDLDDNGNIKKYAVKRIFPTINAAFILIEMLILKYLNGENNVTELIQGYRLEG